MYKDKYAPREPYRRGGVIYEHIYEITCYDDSKNAQYDTVLKLLQYKYPNAQWVSAYHYKDKFEDGTDKKKHHHLLAVFPREISIRRLAYNLEIQENLIEWKQFLDKSVQYLIHLNHPEKAQYELHILEGTLPYLQYFSAPQESNTRNELDLIMQFVHNNKYNITYYDIYNFVRDNQLHSTYHRWYHEIKDEYLDR